MKAFIMFMALVCCAIQLQAQELGKVDSTNVEQVPIDWSRYLSKRERTEIGQEFIRKELMRLDSLGELEQLRYKSEGPREIVFPVEFRPERSAFTSESSNARAVDVGPSGGNITCNINTQTPHVGQGPNGDVVKAKSSGTCTYVHVQGTPPPTIRWDLEMHLAEIISFPPLSTFEVHTRNGLSETWNNSSAQVFYHSCTNGDWIHADLMYIIPPSGWIYTGPQPLNVGTMRLNTIGSC